MSRDAIAQSTGSPRRYSGHSASKFSDRDHRPRISEYSSKRRAIPCRKNGQAAVEISDEHWRTEASVRHGQPSGVTCQCVSEKWQQRREKFCNTPAMSAYNTSKPDARSNPRSSHARGSSQRDRRREWPVQEVELIATLASTLE